MESKSQHQQEQEFGHVYKQILTSVPVPYLQSGMHLAIATTFMTEKANLNDFGIELIRTPKARSKLLRQLTFLKISYRLMC